MSGTPSPERAASAFDAVAAIYDDFYSTPADLADSEVIFSRARRLFRQGPPGIFIDLGCGPGTALRWNVADPDEYVGIDPSAGMIEQARTRWPSHTFVHGDHHAIQPNTAAFVLGGFGPVQYVPPAERQTLIARIVDGLIPGGRFLVMARPHQTCTAVLHDDTVHPVTAQQLSSEFLQAGSVDVSTAGHRRYIDKTWHGQLILLRLERAFPLRPDRCEWLVAEGRRPGGWYSRYGP